MWCFSTLKPQVRFLSFCFVSVLLLWCLSCRDTNVKKTWIWKASDATSYFYRSSCWEWTSLGWMVFCSLITQVFLTFWGRWMMRIFPKNSIYWKRHTVFFDMPIQRFLFLNRYKSHNRKVTVHSSCCRSNPAKITLNSGLGNCGSTSGRLDMFLTSRWSLFSHSACQDVSLSSTFTNLKQNYSVIACGYEDKAKGKGRKTAEGKGMEGRFHISFCILNRACMWGR